ncbi:MAG: hypothetical protein ACTHMO_02030 [Rhodanobacteraceae bacterium]
MARKTCRLTIDADGRDKGKTFVLTELPALDIERWTVRLVLALGRNGVNLPDVQADSGFAGIAGILWVLLAQITPEEADTLMAKMLEGLKIDEGKITRDLVADDIEEATTLLTIRMAWVELHAGFFKKGGRLIWGRLTSSIGASTPASSTSPQPSPVPSPPNS